MKKQITYFLLFFLFACACKKENYKKPNTTVTGIVIDYNTKQPIANAKVTIERYKCRIADLMGGCSAWKEIPLKSVYTDVNGNFSIRFYKDDDRTYALIAEMDGYNNRSLTLQEFDRHQKILDMDPK